MASILEKIAAHLQTHRMAAWEGTFRDYLSLVLQQPTWHSGRTHGSTA